MVYFRYLDKVIFYQKEELRMPKQPFHRKQFTFYASYYEAIDRLPKARQLEAYRLITDYSLHGILPEKISPQVGAVFAALRPNIDASRTKAKARLKELSEARSCAGVLSPAGKKIADPVLPSGKKITDSVLPSGKNKREKENKNKYKYKNENEEEREDEDKGTFPCGSSAADAASALPSETEKAYSLLLEENPALEQPLTELLRYWEERGQPLTELEQRINAQALGVQEPEQQLEGLQTMLRTGARLAPIAAGDR